MNPEITQEQAQEYLSQIRGWLRREGLGLEDANAYVQEQLGFPDYRTFVFFAQNGMTPDQYRETEEGARAEVANMSPLRRFGESMLGGIPFSDEIAGLRMPMGAGPGAAQRQAQAVMQGQEGAMPSYDEGMRNRIRARREVLREDYPGASLAAEMIPSMPLMLTGAGMGARFGATRGMNPMATAALGGGAAGAVDGAVFGFSEGEGLGNRLALGAGGGLFGGAAGMAFGVGSRVGGGLFRRAHRYFSESARSREGRKQAGRYLRRWLSEDAQVGTDDIAERLNVLGPEAVVADAAPVPGGRAIHAARTLSGGALDAPGSTAQRLAGRATERGDRLVNDLRQISDAQGLPVNGKVDEWVAALRNRAQDEFYGPLDEAFGEFRLDEGAPAIWNLFRQDPALMGAAQEIIGGVQRPLRFSDIQYLRNAMREALGRMERSAEAPLGAKESLQRRIAALTEAMGEDFGDDVARADELWAQQSALTNAYEAGLKLGGNNSPLTLQRALANDFANARPQEQMAVLAGAIDRLSQKLIDSPTGGSAGSKMVNEARAMQEWLRTILGEGGMEQLQAVIQREQAFQSTHNYAGLNSLTSMRSQDLENMKEVLSRPGVNRWEWMRKVGEWFTNLNDVNRFKAREIGEALMAGDTAPLEALIRPGARGPLPGSGELEGVVAAGLASPLNRFLLGQMFIQHSSDFDPGF